MRRLTLLLGALLLVACGEHHSGPRTEADRGARLAVRDTVPWTVSASAYGPIRMGSARAAVLAVLGAPPVRGQGAPQDACEYMGIPDSPLARAVRFMVVDDTVVRVDVDSLPVATVWGDRVGDSEGAVIARHAGHVRVEPHKYTGPDGHYLIVTAGDDTLHRVVFETDGHRVTAYRAGLRPYVDWVEGCS
ncbi:MAG TPA: hypothetical protein VF166_06070 [Gemmatimonadaceae bacterium]